MSSPAKQKSTHVTNLPGPREEALFDAIEKGDAQYALELVREGINVHAHNEFSRTPLQTAAKAGMADLIPHLVAAGADLYAEGMAGETPLSTAAVNKRPECLRALIAAGVDVNRPNETNGWTPLYWAVMGSSPKPGMAALLLDFGADPHIADKQGRKPADLAENTATHDAMLSPTLEDMDKFVQTAQILRAHIHGSRQAQRTKALRRKAVIRGRYMPKP